MECPQQSSVHGSGAVPTQALVRGLYDGSDWDMARAEGKEGLPLPVTWSKDTEHNTERGCDHVIPEGHAKRGHKDCELRLSGGQGPSLCRPPHVSLEVRCWLSQAS